ncbi:MAG: hypothetical protein FD152_1251 [Xanthobacteraceae bacterium]|nr:MAG: hypothetical protein FD152_1251 [Xanthobacteraceae bacterium]
MTAKVHPDKTPSVKKRVASAGPGRAGAGNRGEDKQAGDEIGAGTFADGGSEARDLTRGAPPKPVKRYSHAG